MKLLALTPTPKPTLTTSRGFTLVELMVAITIGLIVLGAVAQVFVTSRGTYSVEEGLSRLQENGRFAMNFISEDVRMAGYIGCQDQTGKVDVRLNNPTDYPVTGQIVTGHRYIGSGSSVPGADWAPPLPAMFNFQNNEIETFSDVVVVRRASEQAFRVIAPFMNSEADDVTIASPNGLTQYDLVMVADCRSADLFEITNADPNGGTLTHVGGSQPQGPGNVDGQLSQLYGSNAEVLTLVTHAYFIGLSSSDPPNPPVATDPPALFRKEIQAGAVATVELVDNIENLQFFFGVDSDNTGVSNQYLTADVIGAGSPLWSTTASVRIGMVARTPDETGSDWDKGVYNVVGDTGNAVDDYDPTDDRRQRRVFTSTVNIRNYTQFTK